MGAQQLMYLQVLHTLASITLASVQNDVVCRPTEVTLMTVLTLTVHPAMHLQVGMFPDVCEALSLGHLARGDATSAMVASEWYMRNNHFPGWGRPYEFASELFQKVRCPPGS
jgi:hypothetical protein